MVILIHLVLLASDYHGDHIDADKAAKFGSFIGGYFGTILLIFSVALIGATYRNQKATNEITTFDSRFFELLGFHRENVSEIGIGSDMTGRRVFVSLIREFRDVLQIVNDKCVSLALNYKSEERIDLAYLAFYYGVGPNSTRMLKAAVAHHEKKLTEAVITQMECNWEEHRKLSQKINDSAVPEKEREQLKLERNRISRISYRPFDGHQSRLGHYYRHLFNLIKYVDKHAPTGANIEYADMVRAQLTNHEQALLCLNSLSNVGRTWRSLKYLETYSLIKNIPKDFFNPTSELNIENAFPQIEFEFQKMDTTKVEPNRVEDHDRS